MISLVHDPETGQGKTAHMGKGLFLCFQGRLCSRGAAGFGLPVFKKHRQTFFPTLESLKCTDNRSANLTFSLNRALFWYIAGKKAPRFLTTLSEHLVHAFMKHTAFQRGMLKMRDRIFTRLGVEGRMLTVRGVGACRVSFTIARPDIHIRADGVFLREKGRLIMLNEVDGESFDHLHSGGRVLQGSRIPAWKRTGPDTEITSPRLGLSVSISPEGPGVEHARLFCGRETALGLNWAGLAVTTGLPELAYRLHIRPYPLERAGG